MKKLGILAVMALASSGAVVQAEDAVNPAQKLGEMLFNDTNLSEPKGQACASCHLQNQAFTGNGGASIAAIAQGSTPDKLGTRNVPTIMYMAFSPPLKFRGEADEDGNIALAPSGGQFWDGRANSLIEQASGPLLNPVEMNNPDAATIAAKIKAADYAKDFEAAFGPLANQDDATILKNVTAALAAFEGTQRFMPFSSKFDQVLQGQAKFNDQEAKGFELFKDSEKGNCLSCHVGNTESDDPTNWMFTDFTYDNLGLPRNMAIPANADASYFDLGLCKRDGLDKLLPKDQTVLDWCGAFKVPTLRNVAVTAPYFHNGSFSNLRDAVKFYATRETSPELWYPKSADGKVQKYNDVPAEMVANINTAEKPYDRKAGEKPRLDDAEIDAIVAFLKTLTDKELQ